MKQNTVLCTALALLLLTPLAAQDESFDDGSFFREIGEGTEGPERGGPPEPRTEIGGVLELRSRYTLDEGTLSESTVESVPSLRLDLDYAGKKTDIRAAVRLEQQSAYDDPSSLLEEAYLRHYAGGFDFEAGYMKVVWGPGDGTHAVDVLNPIDYSDFINPSYLERLKAVPMLKLNLPVREGLMELVYLPLFTPDSIPREGLWAPLEARELAAALETAITVASAGDDFTALQMQENAIREESTDDLAHSQFAFRYTTRAGAADLGAVYYMGYYKQPTVDTSNIPTADPHVSLTYDRIHMIGLEAAAAAGRFNFRAETGWYVSEDYEGNDPAVRNSELRWVGGFDYNLALSKLNLNIQETGVLLLDYGNIGSGDVQQDADLHRNRLIVKLSDSWNDGQVLPEVTLIYGFEDLDWRLKPELRAVLQDNLEIALAGGIYGGGSEGFFGQYDENDFVELTVSYTF